MLFRSSQSPPRGPLRSIGLLLMFLISSVPALLAAEVTTNEQGLWWRLLHEPAVVQELQLTVSQKTSYQTVLDRLDQRCFPHRNRSASEANVLLAEIATEARQTLGDILNAAQLKRLTGILLLWSGTSAVLDHDIVKRLQITEVQAKKIRTVREEVAAGVALLETKLKTESVREPLDQKYVELKRSEHTQILAVLTNEQRAALDELRNPSFDVSRLGRAKYKAPELVDTGDWVNSSPITLAGLRGKVVVVHFYAFGCINCQHNFPSYREWQTRYRDRDVAIVGIHTPETSTERKVGNVRQEAAEKKLLFPIVVDGRNENWNAWGNSVWPAVYLIDKQGYLRRYWPGELNWQDSNGQAVMETGIEELLGEPVN